MDFENFVYLFSKCRSTFFLYFICNFLGFSFSFSRYIICIQGFSLNLKSKDISSSLLSSFFIDINFFYCYFFKLLAIRLRKVDFLKKVYLNNSIPFFAKKKK